MNQLFILTSISAFFDWYFGLFKSDDDKLVLAAVGTTVTVVTFLLNFVLKKLFNTDILVELIKLFTRSIMKYWYITLILLVGLIIFNVSTSLLGNFLSVKFVLCALISLIIFDVISLFIVYLRRGNKPINIAVYGCFTVKDNRHLTIDIASEDLNRNIESVVNSASSHYSYSNGFIEIKRKEISKIFPLFFGYNGLNKKIKQRVDSGKHLATLHFVRNKSENKLSVIIYYDEKIMTNSEPIAVTEKLLNDFAISSGLNNSKVIEVSTKIFLLFFGMVYLDRLLNFKAYKEVHYILDSCNKLLVEIRDDFSQTTEKHKNEYEQFIRFWRSNIERYRSIVFLEQKEYQASIERIFSAISLNPYHPYRSYEELKPDYTKKYGIGMFKSLEEVESSMEFEESDPVHNLEVINELIKQVKYMESTWHYDIVHETMRRDMSDENISLIEKELKKLDESDPFVLVMKSEILKYLRKGNEKINEVYVDRVDECIHLLRKGVDIDPSFVLLKSKLGAMLLLKGVHYKNESFTKESMQLMKESVHFLTQLGFKIKS